MFGKTTKGKPIGKSSSSASKEYSEDLDLSSSKETLHLKGTLLLMIIMISEYAFCSLGAVLPKPARIFKQISPFVPQHSPP
jgi:hypothetical protein